jgi:hypothetical protein
MEKWRLTESQIVAILKKRGSRVAVAQLTREHRVGAATYHHCRSTYADAGLRALAPARPAASGAGIASERRAPRAGGML